MYQVLLLPMLSLSLPLPSLIVIVFAVGADRVDSIAVALAFANDDHHDDQVLMMTAMTTTMMTTVVRMIR